VREAALNGSFGHARSIVTAFRDLVEVGKMIVADDLPYGVMLRSSIP
jgi:hypothetical protein